MFFCVMVCCCIQRFFVIKTVEQLMSVSTTGDLMLQLRVKVSHQLFIYFIYLHTFYLLGHKTGI